MLAAAFLGPLMAVAAWAHGGSIPLDFWGGFGPRTGGCQQRIGAAAAHCALQAWRLRRDCAEREIDGTGCDRPAVNRAVEQIRIGATNSIAEPICRAADAAILNFLDIAEARTDVDRSCRETVNALESLVFGSLELPPDPTEADQRCVGTVADAATLLLGSALRERTRMLDRVALRILAPRDKNALLAMSENRVAKMSDSLAERVAASCGEVNPAVLYGRPAEGILADIRSLSDCLVGGTYAQAAVVCDSFTASQLR
jgi:hypothetical protein